ncbi:ATP-binding protein [bacterium]|nr:ATP-binding protein [bacterium]
MQNRPLKFINRISESIIKKDFQSKKIILILGARQVGKTTLIRHILEDKNTSFLNFDIKIDKDRFLAASVLNAEDAMTVFHRPDFLIIDEVQRLPEAAGIVKGWYDSNLPVIFILLGSSSIQIADKAAESLAGRNRKLILPSLTFWEIIRAQSWSHGFSAEQVQQQFPEQIETSLLNCMAFGHYPETVGNSDKRPYLLNLTSDILWKDFLQLGLIKTPESLHQLLTLLAHQIGSEVSVNELSNSTGLARKTVERYLALLEQAFIIFRLPAFSTNPRKEICKSKKIFFWDTGIRNALLNSFSTSEMRPDIGALWENWVIAEFSRQNLLTGRYKKLYFWRSRSGTEVDLIIQQDDRIQPFEIKWNPKKRAKRAFFEQYGVKVQIINKLKPLFFIDKAAACSLPAGIK